MQINSLVVINWSTERSKDDCRFVSLQNNPAQGVFIFWEVEGYSLLEKIKYDKFSQRAASNASEWFFVFWGFFDRSSGDWYQNSA